MIKTPIKIVSVIFFTTVSFSSNALDLKQVVKLAQQNDANYQSAIAIYQTNLQVSTQNKASLLPQLDFNAFIQRGRTENDRAGVITKSDNNSDGYSLNLNQIIYNKTLFDNYHQGNAIAAQAQAQFKQAKQDNIIRATKAYFTVLTAIDTLETANAELKAITQQLKQSKERFKVGIVAITDVKETQASFDIATAEKIIAENKLSSAKEALRIIIKDQPENLKVTQQNLPLAMPEPNDINAWQKKALENNLSLLASNYAVKAAKSAYEASKGGHYPTLSLNASYGIVNAEARNFSGLPLPANENTDSKVVLALNVPLYRGGITNATVRQKSAQLSQAQAMQEQQKRQTTANIRNAFRSLQADIAQVKARKQAVSSTTASLKATKAGYRAGTRTSLDVLLAQRLLYRSQRDYSVARHQYITDSLQLKNIAGELSEKDIEHINQWLN